MENILNSVKEFHTVFQRPVSNHPTLITSDQFTLRHSLMKEENNEYLVACGEGNLIEVADALGDQLYILCGTLIQHGLQHKIVEIFEEIHRSNMTKLDENGKPIFREDGKILKSGLYQRPDLKSILNPSGETEDNQL